MATVPRAPLITRTWSRDPAGIALRSGEVWTNRLLNLLASKDKFFGAPGQPPANLDWPVPRGKPFPQDLRTWTQEPTVPGTPPLAQRDWPVPRGPIPSISLRTWVGGRLIVPEGRPFVQLEWLVPKGKPFPIDLRTWLVNLQEGTFSLPQKPFSLLDWPVTRLRPRSTSLLTWIGGRIITADALPPVFREQTLPPRGPMRNISLLTWVGGRLIISEVIPPTPITEEQPADTRARKRIRGPYSDPRIYEAYIKRCIAERQQPRLSKEIALLKEALVGEVEERRQTTYDEYDALIRENQILQRLLAFEKSKRDLAAISARQRQIAWQVQELMDQEAQSIIMLLNDM